MPDSDVNKDFIADALNLVPIENTKTPLTINVPKKSDCVPAQNEQFEQVQKNIAVATEVAEMAMLELASLASSAQNPRHYEALTALIKTTVEANKDLMETHKINSEIKNKDDDEEKRTTVNNNLMVGSTAELLKMLNKEDPK